MCFVSQILHSHIAAIERLPLTAAGSPLKIKTKIFNVVTFVISRERDCANVYATLIEFSSPSKSLYLILTSDPKKINKYPATRKEYEMGAF